MRPGTSKEFCEQFFPEIYEKKTAILILIFISNISPLPKITSFNSKKITFTERIKTPPLTTNFK
jgi:hypothetical protein